MCSTVTCIARKFGVGGVIETETIQTGFTYVVANNSKNLLLCNTNDSPNVALQNPLRIKFITFLLANW